MSAPADRTRRQFLFSAAPLGAAAAGLHGPASDNPAEDLMRHHGVMSRLLLVYAEAIRRLEAGVELLPDDLSAAAGIVRRFAHDYHEKLEEEHVFKHFEKAGTLVDLVTVLKAQHEAGRRVTADVLGLATPAMAGEARTRQTLVSRLRSFVRMYRPHEAREDTVLFPVLRRLLPDREYRALGRRFEQRGRELLGERGVAGVVDEVAAIEKSLGLYELAQFTAD
jgi:hemerythrin-like domain-containing protein